MPLEQWETPYPPLGIWLRRWPRQGVRFDPDRLPPDPVVAGFTTAHLLWGQPVGRYRVVVFEEERGKTCVAVVHRGWAEKILFADGERAALAATRGGRAWRGGPNLRRAEAIKSAELAVETLAADPNRLCRIDMARVIQQQAEPTVTPEDTLLEAGIDSKRQAAYQRRMSALLAGRA